MHLAEIWRYPVKSMAGERLERASAGPLGLHGDRVVQVYDSRGRLVTARTYPRLLGLHATLAADGEPLVDGRPWAAPDVRARVEAIVGAGARLVRNESAARFDILPLLVATDGAIAAFGRDGRRLRPNLIVGGVADLAERAWEGRVLRIGAVLVGLADLRGRCVMTTVDPDTLAQDPRVLKEIVRRFDGRLALNAEVMRAGELRVGAAVELLAETARRAIL
ncbi:MAG TPA: MOSC N-terminal beta barrel domain-containing protein [Vicinamibacterales bacterium]|nr:MOSC N-terminal beta barrel domain-containing protein [Vicinamibacterales bacterium]HXR45043.1 MOSC N-terminal beta barrel domain-containing protein [Pseudolysinimonas sp.]